MTLGLDFSIFIAYREHITPNKQRTPTIGPILGKQMTPIKDPRLDQIYWISEIIIMIIMIAMIMLRLILKLMNDSINSLFNFFNKKNYTNFLVESLFMIIFTFFVIYSIHLSSKTKKWIIKTPIVKSAKLISIRMPTWKQKYIIQ